MFDFTEPIIQNVLHPTLQSFEIRLDVKRLDLIDPFISGNKWFKLKYNIEEANRLNIKTLLSFGGAYSNHIYALAAAGKRFGIRTIGIIRGEETLPLNDTLKFATDCQMQLEYVSREKYRLKDNPEFKDELLKTYGDVYIIPEGGSNLLGVKGTVEILSEREINEYDIICCCCGTGATLSGILIKLNGNKNALGFSVLKGDFMKNAVDTITYDYSGQLFENYTINNHYHFGGYAKSNSELDSFIKTYTNTTLIPIEHVYTAKMFYGIMDLVNKGKFTPGTKILAIHTGGLR
ncbi:MAG: pyridoxal-phosphate dependent enzyme [Bacteroidota bacterium]|nr:pyridoxal-phosphate dependent enzyme [Bacteroidota bacterium]